MSNPLAGKHLKAWVAAAVLASACAGHHTQGPAPEPTVPFPVQSLAGREVGLLPFTLILAEDSLHWDSRLADRPKVLATADSALLDFLSTRIPEISWKSPARIWRGARGANDLPDDPHQLGVALLRQLPVGAFVPDPLRAQLRTLGAVAGGTYVLAPAALFYKVDSTAGAAGQAPAPGAARSATAELTLVIVDVRLGQVSWRSVARGTGDDPWSALSHAFKTLTPGMP